MKQGSLMIAQKRSNFSIDLEHVSELIDPIDQASGLESTVS